MGHIKVKKCHGCKYVKCGINHCYCINAPNDIDVPRLLRNFPERPNWCIEEDLKVKK